MAQSRLLEGQLLKVDGTTLCNAIAVMEPNCVYCHQPPHGVMIACGAPFHCVLHQNCYPYYSFSGYPFLKPTTEYMSK